MNATSEQIAAINARGKVTVSASAGAGKTTVMIKRLADILEEGADLDDVLCVTFTKKAAAQMKEKLRAELVKRLNCGDASVRARLRAQLGKINSADIGTIDSFCSRLVKTYFYELQVDSSFDVLSDEAEIAELKQRAMDTVFDEYYANGGESFYLLLGRLKKKRSDKPLRNMISDAYDRVRVCADYKKIIDRAGETFTEEGFSRICARLKEVIADKLGSFISAIDAFEERFAKLRSEKRFFEILDDMRESIKSYAQSPSLFGAPARLTALRRPSGDGEEDILFKNFCDRIKKKFKELTDYDEQTERRNFFGSGGTAAAFAGLLTAFDGAYSEVKRAEGKMDFGDLEQYALRLLRGEDCDADVKERINAKYKYVFVDEYQDVNPIQDEIISLAAGGDVFCVGDVKQAIYGFRGSRSEFFAEKCRKAGGGGKYIVLPDNFRSSEKVIGFVNSVFSKVMKPPRCAFVYGDGHAMRGGARYGEKYKGTAEFCLYEKEEKNRECADKVYSVADEKPSAKGFTAEAVAVLHLVEQALKTTYYDPDTGTEKPVQTGDICVLTRKRSNKNVREIVRALSSEYPVAASAEVNVCERPEIIGILDILSYLDNAEQDIPFASALLSPLGGMTESELAAVRIRYGRGEPLFRAAAARYSREADDGIAAKLRAFYEKTARLRTVADSCGAAKLIDEITKGGEFAAEFSSEAKLSYLRALQRAAYGAGVELSLNAFLAKIRAGGNKIAATGSASSDCINVMTMHASKGLEFPVVIVADISAGFKGDAGEHMPFDEEFGFAPRYYGEDRVYGDTVLRRLIAAENAKEVLSNEINLLYVAFTRAKYALYVLTGKREAYDPLAAAYASDYADLIDFDGIDCRILEGQPQVTGGRVGQAVPVLDCPDRELLGRLRAASSFAYGYEQAVTLPVKSSASRLLTERDGVADGQPVFGDEYDGVGTGGARDATPETGVAYHRFLELCDFSVKDTAGVERELSSFNKAGLISDAQMKLLDAEKLAQILCMPAFGLAAGRELYREREFLCRLPSADYVALRDGTAAVMRVGDDDGNGVLVQGAIDLLCVERENGKAVAAGIIDYKYTSRTDAAVREKYAAQLGLYKSVVRRIYGLGENDVTVSIINIRALRQIDM